MQLFGGGQVLIHQHADGNGQRLGAHIARHIQHHGLEADDDGQDGHHRLEGAHHRGHQHPEEKQGDQPRQTLFDALEHALVQVLLAGQTAQLCVIIAHLIIHQLDDIRRGDDAHQLSGVVQDGQRTLGIVHDTVDAVADLLVVRHIGVRPGDELLEAVVRPGDDEVFQIDGTVELLVLVHDIEGGDVVVLAGLLHQLTHGLPDGHVLPDADVVGGHAAADLVFSIGQQHLHVLGGVLVQLADDLGLILFLEVVQCIHSVVRVHVRDDLCGLLAGQLLQVRFRVIQIGEDLGHTLHAQHGVELLAFVGRQGLEGVGKVILMVIGELFGQLSLRQAAVDEVEYLLLVVLLLHLGFLLPFWGIKIHRVVFWSDSCGVSGQMHSGRGRAIRCCPHRRRSVVWVGLNGRRTFVSFPPVNVFAFSARSAYYAGTDFSTPFTNFLLLSCQNVQKSNRPPRRKSGCSRLF